VVNSHCRLSFHVFLERLPRAANLATIRATVITAIKDVGYLHIPEGRHDHTTPAETLRLHRFDLRSLIAGATDGPVRVPPSRWLAVTLSSATAGAVVRWL
jgi:hypothetical protein